jgi:DNA-binding SARP family transcriptional activator/tetratricopeptide (TPR) repeat protein
VFTLRTLGGLRLENGADPPVTRAAQRRRLALLVALSLAPDKRLARSRLLLLLWPDVSEEQARARLSAAIYDVRGFLGETSILSQGDEVRLNTDALTTDVELWEAAVSAGEWEKARALYGGPFLDGVHITAAPEFDAWSSGTRERLTRRHRAVLEQAAVARHQAGDAGGALECWRETFALDPLDVRVTCRLMKTLAACGHRAEAIRLAEQSARMLSAELGAAPDGEVEALAERLRHEPVALAAPLEGDVLPPPAPERDAPPSLPPARPVQARPRRAAFRWVALGAGGVAVAAVLSIALALSQRSVAHGGEVDAAVRRVAVLPFSTSGVPDSTVGRAIAELLSASLDGSQAYASVAPRVVSVAAFGEMPLDRARARDIAARFGADRYVLGSVTGDGGTRRVKATFYDRRSGESVAEVRTELAQDGLVAAVDDITRQFVAAELRGPADHLASVGALTTHSTAAMHWFILGEGHFRAGRFLDAVKAYQRAADADSTFALAHYRLSLATIWGNVPLNSAGRHDSLALAYADRLSDRERSLLRAYVSWRRGDGEVARAAYFALVRRYPDDVDAWHQYGETIFHYNPVAGLPIADARTGFHTAVLLDSLHWGAQWHLALLDGLELGRGAFLRSVPRLLALSPDSSTALGVRLLAADTTGGALARVGSQADGFALLEAAWRRTVYLRDLAGAAVLYRALAAPGRDGYSVAKGAYGLAAISLGSGRWDAARRLVTEHYEPSLYREGLTTLVEASVLAPFARGPAELEALARDVDAWDMKAAASEQDGAAPRVGAAYLHGVLAAARGDTTRAMAIARELRVDTLGVAGERRQSALTLRALVSYRGGRYGECVARLDSARVRGWFGDAASSPWSAQTFQRLLRAEALRALGRWQDAVQWYNTLEQYAPFDVALLGPVLLGRSDALQRMGAAAEARENYARFAALWRNSDERYAVLVRDAAERARPAATPARR